MRINVIPEAGWKWRATEKVKLSKHVSRQGEHELLLYHTTTVSRDIGYTGGQRMGWMIMWSNVCKPVFRENQYSKKSYILISLFVKRKCQYLTVRLSSKMLKREVFIFKKIKKWNQRQKTSSQEEDLYYSQVLALKTLQSTAVHAISCQRLLS